MLKFSDTTWSCMSLLYTLRQPQPPAKYIRFYGKCQSLYTRIRKINFLTIIMGCYKIAIMDNIDKLINSTKQLALQEMKEKIQQEIDKLEKERKEADEEEIPF